MQVIMGHMLYTMILMKSSLLTLGGFGQLIEDEYREKKVTKKEIEREAAYLRKLATGRRIWQKDPKSKKIIGATSKCRPQ
jgi:hypothetical protein